MTGRVWEAQAPQVPAGSGRGQRLLGRVLAGSGPSPAGEVDSPLRHAVHLPPRQGCPVDWPDWVPPAVREAFVDRGVRQPWSHQARAAELARIEAVVGETLRHVISLGGTVAAEHGVGKIKRKWVDLQLSSLQLGAMRALKKELDPLGLLAPGNVL